MPKIDLDIKHFILHKGTCPNCGQLNKGIVSREHLTGYGPRLSVVIAELAGSMGDSRSTVQQVCSSVLDFSISRRAIQKVIDRVSAAINPHYEAIREQARTAVINHVDETSWRNNRLLCWLWVLTNSTVAFFMIHRNRSGEAFKQLVKEWKGILISDGYKIYQSWGVQYRKVHN
ncbi:MAG: transposase [Desulfobulbaceae bacterium]|nr:transposase [Desulfobulbaceae bacterium]